MFTFIFEENKILITFVIVFSAIWQIFLALYLLIYFPVPEEIKWISGLALAKMVRAGVAKTLLPRTLKVSMQFLTFSSSCLDDHGNMWQDGASISLGFKVTTGHRAHSWSTVGA